MPNSTEPWPSSDERIVILAPTGQDATLMAAALAEEKVATHIVGSVEAASQEIALGRVATLLLADEALSSSGIKQLNQALESQAPWSDVPIILMTSTGNSTLAITRITEAFSPAGNINLLERPFRRITLRSVVQVALRARRKQHQVRELLDKQVAATRMRDEFISIASHELKTPLTSLRLQTQLNQRRITQGDARIYEPDTTRKLVESTHKQVDRLVHLVEDMLDVSRINLNKLHLRIEDFDLVDLVAETVERMQPQAAAVACQIKVIATAAVKGSWDRFRVEQVVTNLLSNAIRYCPGLPIEVTVSNEGDSAKVSVRDYGPGIALDSQDRIFERFERGATGSKVSGMGVGLYICREIATAHGGSVTVQSELAQGSVFTLTLPIRQRVLRLN